MDLATGLFAIEWLMEEIDIISGSPNSPHYTIKKDFHVKITAEQGEAQEIFVLFQGNRMDFWKAPIDTGLSGSGCCTGRTR